MGKILVTGGPVHAHLDSVKIVTNRFKGGRMLQLAADLARDRMPHEVIYLTSKHTPPPEQLRYARLKILQHNGFDDYMGQVLDLAPDMDAVILGAAVCNLIPDTPWKDSKFPSHDYKEGDEIQIKFKIAPRVINMVKNVAKRTTLIGFKLLSNANHEELIRAAYQIVADSKATFVVANDTADLNRKFIVTRERSVISAVENATDSASNVVMSDFIAGVLDDKHYHTIMHVDLSYLRSEQREKATARWKELAEKYKALILKTGYEPLTGQVFGCLAVRAGVNGFVVSPRVKNSLENRCVYVHGIDHDKREITTAEYKAALNAPLLHKLFEEFPDTEAILHYHFLHNKRNSSSWLRNDVVYPELPYAFPGTVADSIREIDCEIGGILDTQEYRAFGIKHHGTYLLLRKGEAPDVWI